MISLLTATVLSTPALADGPLPHASLTPLLAVTSWRPPVGDEVENNLGLGAQARVSLLTPGSLGVHVQGDASYLGVVGTDNRGREWRVGAAAGPRIGTKRGEVTELSLTVLAGLDVINDTYRFDALGDAARVPQAWLLGVPFELRAVVTLIDFQLGISPQVFLDRQVGDVEIAPTERPAWEGTGDEFETSSGIGLRLGSAFRVGVSQRTRWTSYGTLTYFGLGFGVGV